MPLFIGYFTERPYQDRDKDWYHDPEGIVDLELSNGVYDPEIGSDLYHRYIDERVALEDHGFDGVMLNSHHSTPFCMGGGPMNIEAALIAKLTEKLKIVLMGNILPIWDDPLLLVEELAMIDLLSKGRLVSGWVRGTGRESWAHNAQPAFNWERFQEAHDFIVKAWSTPGAFRWEGRHYNYRYVNPWVRPYQKPHPPVWVPGAFSKRTVEWAVQERFPYLQLATALPATKVTFDYYREKAAEAGWEAGSQHLGYLFHVHVEETEEKAWEVGRKIIDGPGNLFLNLSRGNANFLVQNLPGLTPRSHTFLDDMGEAAKYVGFGGGTPGSESGAIGHASRARGIGPTEDVEHEKKRLNQLSPEELRAERDEFYTSETKALHFITGTPDSVVAKIRTVLETLRPGQIFLWDGDGDQTHDDTMRSMRLMGDYVVPAVREIGKELGLESAFSIDPKTNEPIGEQRAAAVVS